MERRSTGGAKEFSYTAEDAQRIRSTDTRSTKAFKDAYHDWQRERYERLLLERQFKRQRFVLAGVIVLLVLALVLAAIALL